MPDRISFLTAHFHDFGWTELLVRQIVGTTPAETIEEILIINQDRTSVCAERLSRLHAAVRVVEYPPSPEHFRWTRHDHAAVLNVAIQETNGSLICIFDSDAHPIDRGWYTRCGRLLQAYDAVLATEPGHPEATHPCFMMLRQRHTALGLAFDEGLFEDCTDTGRLIGRQLRRAGERVYLAVPKPAFGGRYGSIYLGSLYHHGKGSFRGVNDPLLANQLRWEDRFFRARVLHDRVYHLDLRRVSKYATRRALAAGSRRLRARGKECLRRIPLNLTC